MFLLKTQVLELASVAYAENAVKDAPRIKQVRRRGLPEVRISEGELATIRPATTCLVLTDNSQS
jgi:hypothetical protein